MQSYVASSLKNITKLPYHKVVELLQQYLGINAAGHIYILNIMIKHQGKRLPSPELLEVFNHQALIKVFTHFYKSIEKYQTDEIDFSAINKHWEYIAASEDLTASTIIISIMDELNDSHSQKPILLNYAARSLMRSATLKDVKLAYSYYTKSEALSKQHQPIISENKIPKEAIQGKYAAEARCKYLQQLADEYPGELAKDLKNQEDKLKRIHSHSKSLLPPNSTKPVWENMKKHEAYEAIHSLLLTKHCSMEVKKKWLFSRSSWCGIQ